jgi:hypothetical protein
MTSYVCTITYGAVGTPATYIFSPAITATDVHPDDTISFVFQAGTNAPVNGAVEKAVLIAGWRENSTGDGSSPFVGNSNNVDLMADTVLTIGHRMGKWGFVVTSSVVDSSGMTHFYYLPDPEIVITPGGG